MVQRRTFQFHDLDASTIHNLRFDEVVQPGIYRGYFVRRNLGDPSMLDITKGNDRSSVLVTIEGVRVEEMDDLIGILKVQAADPVYTRIDLIVSEYQFSANNSIDQTYKIIRGAYQRNLDQDPVPPVTENEYQIPLAIVWVRPITAVAGVRRVNIDQTDIILSPRASDVASGTGRDYSALRPIIDPTNRKRIFVYPGSFPTLDGDALVQFGGGYSEEITAPITMVDGDERYYLFGVADDSSLSIAGESVTFSTIPNIGSDVLPLCVGKTVMRGGEVNLEALIDIRFPFARRLRHRIEEDFYLDLLADSVFEMARIDTFREESFIDLDTLSPSSTYLTASISVGDTSLAIRWSTTGSPPSDVTIATSDLLAGSDLSAVRHIMVLVDSDISNLTFDYSAASAYGGFTGRNYDPNVILELPGGASQLFIKFKIPASQFDGDTTKKIFSYTVLMGLDYETLNKKSITELGLQNLEYSIRNLIPNGDFRVWSRPLEDGTTPDINARDKITYPIDSTQFASREKIFAADGWQFTKLEFDSSENSISRILWSRDVLGSTDENTMDTALEWKGAGGTGTKVAYLEFRSLVSPLYVGRFVTFSFEYQTMPREAVGIRLVLYKRNSDGSLSIQSETESGPLREEGTLLIQSDASINEETYAVGCIVVFNQTTGISTVYVRRARAAVGQFEILPFTLDPDAENLCRAYYERGRVYAAASVEETEEVGVSTQFGAKKLIALAENGAVRAREHQHTEADRSVNVSAVTFDPDENGLVVRGRAATAGLAIVDLDWEAAVIYGEAT